MRDRQSNRRFLRWPWRSRAAVARDVDEELAFHLEMRVAELVAQGVEVDGARRRAIEEFGDLEFTRRYCQAMDTQSERSMRIADMLAEWRQDARYAVRTLRRRPGFTAIALVTLALAIGANTAVFSVARAVLLAPLPYADPASLVRIYDASTTKSDDNNPFAPANYVDYRAQQKAFTDIAAFQYYTPTWASAQGDPEIVAVRAVTTNMFDLLGGRALRGRTFFSTEAGSESKVVLSYRFWQRALGGSETAIGQRATINGVSVEIVGIMPPSFTLGTGEDMWMPLVVADAVSDPVRSRRQHYVHLIARIKPGVSIDAARADLATIGRRLEAQYPDANSGRTAVLAPLHDALAGDLRPALLLLQGAALLVLLIACANLANLTLSRVIGRHRELALRAALGAGRGRLMRQLLVESTMLSVGGGVIGVGVAALGTRTLLALNPDALPPMFDVAVDMRVLAFCAAIAIATGLLFGLIPALDAARVDLNESLKDGARGTSGARGGERVRRSLVVAQVGLAVMLLVGAGLLVRSFRELTRTRLGYDPDRVLTALIRTSGAKYDSSTAVNQFYDQVLGGLTGTPGVVAAGAMDVLPSGGSMGTALRIVGEAIDEAHLPDVRYLSVRGDAFAALRVPIVAGRGFDATDAPGSPETVLVNQTLARRYFPKGDAIGRRVSIGPDPKAKPMTIVGIVADMRAEKIDLVPKPMLITNHRIETWEHTMSLVVRTTGDPSTIVGALKSIVHTADPTLALRDVEPLETVLGSSLAPRKLALALATCFAAIAVILAAIGIYGVLSYAVASRTREFGVRFALGASTHNVLLIVLRQGVAWSLIGLVLGVVGALEVGRLLSAMLYGVAALDPATYVSVVVGLIVVVGAACVVPAFRAMRVDPMTAMRE